MRYPMIVAALLLATACTPQSSGLSFNDLTRGASNDINAYQTWVKMDARHSDGKPFPAGLCLAAVVLEANLADTSASNAGVSIPLAAPSAGLTGMFGYDFRLTEDNVDKITVPMHVAYQAKSPHEAVISAARDAARSKPGANAATIRAAVEKVRRPLIQEDLTKFRENLQYIRDDRFADAEVEQGILKIKAGTVRPPRDKNGDPIADFSTRNDLAAELWRIREGIHDMVANSPEGMLVFPSAMTFVREYRLVNQNDVGLTVNMGSTQVGQIGNTSTRTAFNRLAIFFVPNASGQIMVCDRTSLADVDWSKIKLPGPILGKPELRG